MLGKEEAISAEDIDVSYQPYRITTDRDISFLSQSIKNSGLIRPCIFRRINNRIVVVAGHKRVDAVRRIRLKQLPGKIVKESQPGTSASAFCARIAVTDNSFDRPLNTIEMARSVKLLNETLSVEMIEADSAIIFNRKLNRQIIETYLRIAAMPTDVHNLIVASKLSFKGALKLSDHDSPTLKAFAYIFNRVRMGQNKQIETLTFLKEIALRENTPVLALLKTRDIINIVDGENSDENYKGNLLRSYLLKRRFPELTKTQDAFEEGIKKIKLPSGIKLDPPINFEGEEYSVSFGFKNSKDFQEKLKHLETIKDNPLFKKLVQ